MRYLVIVFLSLLFTFAVIAQDSCTSLVTDALETLNTVCETTGRNELCYGNNLVSVTTISGQELYFSQPGDIISIDDIQSIRTSPFAQPDEWGIALMKLQANIPDSLPGQNVTFLLFGDTELDNADTEQTIPMQAVYFSSGIGKSTCENVPQDGLLIQSPEYDEPIELNINEVEIELGSTIYLQAEADNQMALYVLEGSTAVTAKDETVTVPEGAMTTIALDENLAASGPPAEPKEYVIEDLSLLPISALEQDIEIAQPINSASANPITPLDGLWQLKTMEDTCSGIRPSVNRAENLTFSFDPFDMISDKEGSFRESIGTLSGGTYNYSNPEPNVYIFDGTGPDALSFVMTVTILSETSVEWSEQTTIGNMTCAARYLIEYVGG